jgi:glycosyltransferase involved in cell wall biosynthesis
MMRILQVVPTYLPATRYGGPIFAVHGLSCALAARGHHVEIFTTNVDGPNNSAVPLGISVPLDGVQVRYFPSKIFRRLYWSPPLARALCDSIRSFAVVHLHSVFLWPTWAAARSARKAEVPYLISPRGMLVKELIEQRSRLVKSAWIELVEKANLECARAIHVTSELEAAELQRFAWRLPAISIIANGVEEKKSFCDGEVAMDVKEIARERPFVLFLGRFSWKKGLDRLLRAFALTRSGTLAIVGPDDEKLAPRLAEVARDLQITNRVRFLTRTILDGDKEYLYASAQVVALSSYSENFGNTVLEGMQRGVPVVVTPEVGAAEIVRESGGGIVTPGDPEPLGAAITRLIEDPDLARSMGDAGKRHVAQYYTWARVAADMEDLYARLRVK